MAKAIQNYLDETRQRYKLLEEENKALAKSLSELVPGSGIVLEFCSLQWKNKRLKGIQAFLKAADFDGNYYKKLSKDEALQDLFMEYIQSAGSQTSELGCMTLALVYRDPELSEEVKSLIAKSLQGISSGTINALTRCMDKYDELHEAPIPFRPTEPLFGQGVEISFEQLGYSNIESFAYVSDLKQRGICTSGSTMDKIGDHKSLSVNELTLVIYKHMKNAKELIGSSSKK